MTTSVPTAAVATQSTQVGLPNPSLTANGQAFRVSVRAQSRRLARVRVLGKPRVSRRGGRTLAVPVHAGREVWLGVGLSAYKNPVRETVMLARAKRGRHKLRVPVPASLPRGRYLYSIRGGAMEGRFAARIRLPAG
jgi:hypothetical protein